MDDIPAKVKLRRLSSILKNPGIVDSPTQTFNRRSKRISFSHVNNVKEFVADGDNQTIWGESYEKSVHVSGTSAVSVSSERNEASESTSANQNAINENITHPPRKTILMFADIENDIDSDGVTNGKTEIPFHQGESVMLTSSTKSHQTICVNESMTFNDNVTIPAITTSMKNMSDILIVSGGIKRKNDENIIEDSIAQSSTVKIRKFNDSNMDLTLVNVQQCPKIEDISMETDGELITHLSKQTENLNETRFFDADSIADSLPRSIQTSDNQSPVKLASLHINNTTTTTCDMNIDDPSMITFHVFRRNEDKTISYGYDHLSADVDQTISVRNPLQENRFNNGIAKESYSDITLIKANDDPDHSLNETQSPYSLSILDNSVQVIEDLTVSMDINFKTELSYIEESQSPIINFLASTSVLNDTNVEELKKLIEEEERSPSFYNIKDSKKSRNGNRSIHYDVEKSSKYPLQSLKQTDISMDELEKRRDKEQRRSPSFYQIGPSVITDDPNNVYRNDLHIQKTNSVSKSLLPSLNQTAMSTEELKKRHEEEQRRSPSFYHCGPTAITNDPKDVYYDGRHIQKTKGNPKNLLPSLNQCDIDKPALLFADNPTSECVVKQNISLTQPSKLPVNREPISNCRKLSQNACFDCSFTSSEYNNQYLPLAELSFGCSEPLSSTRRVSTPYDDFDRVTPNSINSDRKNCTKSNISSPTFNYCQTLTARHSRDLRSALSMQNNTDELCNLEPDQLQKRTDIEKVFSNIACGGMLSDTTFDLVEESTEQHLVGTTREELESVKIELALNQVVNKDVNKLMNEGRTINKPVNQQADELVEEVTSDLLQKDPTSRCKKCINWQRSIEAENENFLKIEDIQLNLSVYDQFKGFATFKDVIDARKKRQALRESEKPLLMDQNVDAPDIRFLWKNKLETTTTPKTLYVPRPLVCFPMRMSIEYLLKNKITSEYTNWKYDDNFFYIGAIVLRYLKIPSIKIHVKFDSKGPKKAQELNMPLLFKKVFIEECPAYMKNISAINYLKHTHALDMLPWNLINILSDSDAIYKALDEIDRWFESAVRKVSELFDITVECGALVKMDERQCYVEQTLFDFRTYFTQTFVIKLDKIDTISPRNVFFQPPCATTDEFKNFSHGLPFLRAFLNNPKSVLLPFLQS